MALAAVKDSGTSRRHLAPVAGEVSLADRLAVAEAGVTEPRRRVDELEAALSAAIERRDFAAAAEVQEQLPAAREALAIAEVDVRVITETQAALSAVADAERRQLAEAQQRDQAQRELEDAAAAEQQAMNSVRSAIGTMRGHLAAAHGALQRARGGQDAALAARHRAMQARVALGEFPPGSTGPIVIGPSEVTALAGTDPLVKALSRWHP